MISKIAIVTGASEGIGFACAQSLLSSGNRVCIVSRNEAKLKKAVQQLSESFENRVTSFAKDLSEKDAIQDIQAYTKSIWGDADILVNSNGGPKPGTLLTLSEEDWNEAFQTFALPVINAIRVFSRSMIKKSWGRIITIGSIASKEPIENLDLSNFIRAGLLGLHKSLSKELGKYNINVHMVQPGSIMTSRTNERILKRAESLNISFEESRKISESKIPLGRIGLPSDVGNLVKFLCSDESNYITGASLQVDGGMSNSI